MEGASPFRLVPGDIGDLFLVDALFEEHRPDLILHAAAYKHVPLMEANPFAAVQNNAILTWQLAKAAAEAGLPQLLMISTDKAANPHSILGASKKVAEQAVLRWSGPSRRYTGIRLVNVLGSEGSALPLFLEQIDHDGPLTITHPEAARYFMTLEDTVRLILAAAALPDGGVVYVPEVSAPVRIVEIAERLVRHKVGGNRTIPIEFTGLRPGEKLREDLLSTDESLRATPHPSIHEVVSPPVSLNAFDHAFAQLCQAVKRRHLDALLEALGQLVPTYQPSGALCLDQVCSHG
jgi:FlaA1/EpsC-like NDP-sugar epimerase